MSVLKKILLLFILLLSVAYLVVAVVLFSRKDANRVCAGVDISFKDTTNANFVSKSEIETILNQNSLHPKGQNMDRIHTDLIEKELLQHQLIDHVECYKLTGDRVKIEASLRIPLLRIMASNGENYYLDNKGNIMPYHTKCITDLAVVTGRVEKSFVKRRLFEFGKFLQQDKFWNSQIEQINVLPDETIELVPRVGDHIIYLGSVDNFKQKLARLEKFYRRALNKVGWNKYSRINVEFSNQIICTKRNKDE